MFFLVCSHQTCGLSVRSPEEKWDGGEGAGGTEGCPIERARLAGGRCPVLQPQGKLERYQERS